MHLEIDILLLQRLRIKKGVFKGNAGILKGMPDKGRDRLFGNMLGGMMLGALIYAMLVGSNFIPIWISVAAVVLTVLLLTKQYKKLKTLEKGKKALAMGLAIICMLPLFPMAIVHGYFDVFAGCLQAYIFCMLSMLFIAA